MIRRSLLLALAAALAAPAGASALPSCDPAPEARVLLSGQGRLESITSDARGRLFFTDLSANRLLRLDRPGAEAVVLDRDMQRPGGLAFDADGSLVAGFGNGVAEGTADNGQAGLFRIDPETGAKTVWLRGLGMANGVVRGPDGAFYASNDFGNDIDRVLGGQVEPDWARAASTNGLAIDTSGRWLYAAQTFVPAAIARVEIANPANVTTHYAAPAADSSAGLDGLTRDDRDRLFVAANGASEVWRVDGDGSACVLARNLGLPSALAFGGGAPGFDANNLYVVTFSGTLVELAGATDRPPPAGTPATPTPRPKLRVRARPRRVAAGRRVGLRFRVTSAGAPVAGAKVRLRGRRARTNVAGRARIKLRFRRAGSARARATRTGYRRGAAVVRVRAHG